MYKKGDIVLVAGAVCDGISYKNYKFTVAKVKEVGLYDLLIEIYGERSYYGNAIFKVSKKTCQLINTSTLSTHASVKPAEIGDLVLAYQSNYKETIEEVGILMTVRSQPGLPHEAEVLCGDKKVVVRYDSLMILEKKCKK